MAVNISQTDRARVEAAIKDQETRTSGEIVVVVASQCDDYIHVPIHIATGVALALPLALPLLSGFFPWSSLPLRWVFVIQLFIFIAVALVLSIEQLRWLVTPKSLKRKYASRFAAAEFLALDMHRTLDRTGVLIFVALRERYVEIICDVSAGEQIGDEEWQTIILGMRSLLRLEKLTEALVLGVDHAGGVLRDSFPPRARNPNEISDKLIVVDEAGTTRFRKRSKKPI
jgi:putative membrane protein